MICSLLIMTILFINGIENSKQKVKHLDAVWKEEDIDAKTKAWLLMVESGKVDEEELRRITPKSIFIAPLLTSRSGKCQEGYSHNHLGECVKVIKPDPKIQLDLLLKRLSSFYSEKSKPPEKEEEEVEEEEEEKEFFKPSSGPLQFSIPIWSEEEKEVKQTVEESKTDLFSVNASTFVPPKPFEFLPFPEEIVMPNRTIELNENRTEEVEFSGAGPLNDTEPFITTGYNFSDVSSGDYFPEEEVTTPDGLFLEDTD